MLILLFIAQVSIVTGSCPPLVVAGPGRRPVVVVPPPAPALLAPRVEAKEEQGETGKGRPHQRQEKGHDQRQGEGGCVRTCGAPPRAATGGRGNRSGGTSPSAPPRPPSGSRAWRPGGEEQCSRGGERRGVSCLSAEPGRGPCWGDLEGEAGADWVARAEGGVPGHRPRPVTWDGSLWHGVTSACLMVPAEPTLPGRSSALAPRPRDRGGGACRSGRRVGVGGATRRGSWAGVTRGEDGPPPPPQQPAQTRRPRTQTSPQELPAM